MSGKVMVKATGVHKFYGDFEALCGVSLDIDEGDVVVICGPSGSGKSTFLRCINGLESIQAGDIVVDGLSVADPKTNMTQLRSEVGMVFQQFNLYPHMSALHNITLAPIKVRGVKKDEAEKRPTTCSARWEFPKRRKAIPPNYPAGSSSAWPSPAPSPCTRRSCSSTRPRARWTPKSSTKC